MKIHPLRSINDLFILAIFPLFLLAGAGDALAVTWEVIGPCSTAPLYQGEWKVGDLSRNVGQVTLDIFNAEKIPFEGNEAGINTIAGSPTGDAALEIMSDRRMRAYGLCFSVNGVLPEVYMDHVFFLKESDHLRWFYGYSDYDSGVWKNYCQASSELHPPFLCH